MKNTTRALALSKKGKRIRPSRKMGEAQVFPLAVVVSAPVLRPRDFAKATAT